MKLVHSLFFFEKSVKLQENFLVETKTGIKKQKISNFFRDKNIFTAIIQRELNKKKSLQNYKRFFNNKQVNCNICYNSKLIVNVNINALEKAVKNNKFYDRQNFFALLKRNVENINTVNSETSLDDILNKNQVLNESLNFSYYGKSVIKIENLFFDLDFNRIYFNEKDIQRNYHKFDLSKTKIMFTDNVDKINNILLSDDLFYQNNQNLIIYSENEQNIKNIIKNHKLINYVYLNTDNISQVTYSDIVNKTIIISYETLIEKYKYNILMNTENFNDTTSDLEFICERYNYETSFMKREKFLDMNYVLLHSLTYDNLIILDFKINKNKFMNNFLLSSFKTKNAFFISPFFLEYKISNFIEQLSHFFKLNLEPNSISLSFIKTLLSNIYIDDYSNLKKERRILYNYSKNETEIITNSPPNFKEKLSSLPLLFPLGSIDNESLKHINNTECPICFDKLKLNNTVKTSCNHYFCVDCATTLYNNSSTISCSLCRTKLDKNKDIKQLIGKSKTVQGKIGKIFQNLTKDSVIVSSYNENLLKLSKILQDSEMDLNNISLINKKMINSRDFVNSKSLLFLENSVDKYTRYLFKNSEIKVLVPVKEPT